VRVVTPAPRDVWREVLQSDSRAFVYQTPEGIDALCAEHGMEDVSRMYEFPDGRRVILPLCRGVGRPKLWSTETSPLVGSIVSHGPVRPDELKAVFEDLAARTVFRVRIVPTAFEGGLWESVVPQDVQRLRKVAHVVELGGNFEAVWTGRFSGQARRNVRKAEKADLEVECGFGDALLPEFYDLFRKSVDRWAQKRSEPQFVARWRSRRRSPFEKLRRRMVGLGEACRIWMARVGGRPAAAIVVLQGANAHYNMGAMDRDLAGPTRANFLLHKLAIEDACAAGCHYYNMGETGSSESLARFKRQFGAEEYTYHEYRVERVPVTAVERKMKGWVRRVLHRGGTRSG
jgi:hypothetical protein